MALQIAADRLLTAGPFSKRALLSKARRQAPCKVVAQVCQRRCKVEEPSSQKVAPYLTASIAAGTLLLAEPSLALIAAQQHPQEAVPAALEFVGASGGTVTEMAGLMQAPVLGPLAEDSEDVPLTPAERARRLAAEYRRKKEEEEAAKAAAAAAAAAEAAKAEEAAVAARAAAAPKLQARATEPAPNPRPTKSPSRGGMPLAVSQLGVLAAYSGVVAAATFVPNSIWGRVQTQADAVGEKLLPVLDDAVEKAKPAVAQVKEKADELLVQARPYAIKAFAATREAAAIAVEASKPVAASLVAKATESFETAVANIKSDSDKSDSDEAPAKSTKSTKSETPGGA